jgi:hypothetical protein
VQLQPIVAPWTVDTIPPETTILTGPIGDVASHEAHLTFTANEPATFECSLDGAAYQHCASPYYIPYLRLGQHILFVRATDRAGNREAAAAVRIWNVVQRSSRSEPENAAGSGPSTVPSARERR